MPRDYINTPRRDKTGIAIAEGIARCLNIEKQFERVIDSYKGNVHNKSKEVVEAAIAERTAAEQDLIFQCTRRMNVDYVHQALCRALEEWVEVGAKMGRNIAQEALKRFE